MNGTCPSIFLQRRKIVVSGYSCKLFVPNSKLSWENFCIEKKAHGTEINVADFGTMIYQDAPRSST
jgi:hypothetical protein